MGLFELLAIDNILRFDYNGEGQSYFLFCFVSHLYHIVLVMH